MTFGLETFAWESIFFSIQKLTELSPELPKKNSEALVPPQSFAFYETHDYRWVIEQLPEAQFPHL